MFQLLFQLPKITSSGNCSEPRIHRATAVMDPSVTEITVFRKVAWEMAMGHIVKTSGCAESYGRAERFYKGSAGEKGSDVPPHLMPDSFNGDTVTLVGPDNEPAAATNPIAEHIRFPSRGSTSNRSIAQRAEVSTLC